jgi:hypothetical protein
MIYVHHSVAIPRNTLFSFCFIILGKRALAASQLLSKMSKKISLKSTPKELQTLGFLALFSLLSCRRFRLAGHEINTPPPPVKRLL